MLPYILPYFFRSPGKILSVSIPTFEALTQFGMATITTKNIGEVEASYSLTVLLLKFSSSCPVIMSIISLLIMLRECSFLLAWGFPLVGLRKVLMFTFTFG
jgi:hypothetical protein